MRLVTLEEHVTFPELLKQVQPERLLPKETAPRPAGNETITRQLNDVAEERLRLMDESGITMQVLSVVGMGAESLKPREAVRFATEYNNAIAQKIARYQHRFAAFAHLPMTDPEAAAAELERTVTQHHFKGALINGLTNDQFLDDPAFAPVFEQAVKLDVPIYLHPSIPPQSVVDAYYSNLPGDSGLLLSIAGWGWHSETAIHVLRLIISGIFDKYPSLKLIIGHMGEMLPMMAARCDNIFKPGTGVKNQRSISETLSSQVYITTSGLFTLPPLMAAISVFGIDHVLFSVDYPYSSNAQGRKFIDSIPLAPADLEKIAHGNADKLLKL